MFNKFKQFVIAHDPDKGVSESEIIAARPKIEIAIKAYLSRQQWGDNGYYLNMNKLDDTFNKAIEQVK